MQKKNATTKKAPPTDWNRIRRLTDEDIDYSDIPPAPDDFLDGAIYWPGRKQQITLRLDPDVLAFFKKTGRGYQTVINGVLRRHMESRRRPSEQRKRRAG